MKSGNASAASVSAADIKTGNVNAYLKQNAPNPFTQNSSIQYYLPESARNAQLIVYAMDGRQVKSFALNNGVNQVTINAGTLSAGQYMYSLVVDGKKVDTKNMVITK